jgi:hypothetical protein
MSHNAVGRAVHITGGAGGLAAAPLNEDTRVYRVVCNAGAGAYRLRDGSASGPIKFDETMAVAGWANFNDVPIWFKGGIYVDALPATPDITVYIDK